MLQEDRLEFQQHNYCHEKWRLLSLIYIFSSCISKCIYYRVFFYSCQFQIAVGIFPICKKNVSNQNMNVLLYTMKYHNFNTKKFANSVISFEPYSNVVFSKEPKIWIVQNYSSDKWLTQLRRDYTWGLDLSYLSVCISV